MKIFITGITGTLGEAFANHLESLGHIIIGVDHNEERVAAFRREHPDIDVRLGDFGDEAFTSQPDLVIHLAAFKHIDLCEATPSACISNNVIKTFNLFQAARRNNVGILFMSTDKAVEPQSVYGYSKALMETMALELGGAIARSGNILASNGSVLTVWEQAIKAGEPLTITHKEMRRYFISPENFATRAWDLYLAGETVIIPEMDMDIRMVDLAERVLHEFGHCFHEYPIKYTGLRPGEKLVEKLHKGD
jgi:FlaA1/EpsC-like NDP-sugar epimerase